MLDEGFLGPGVYLDLSDARYHADDLCERPSLSNSLAKELMRSPLHAWTHHPRLNPCWQPTETKTFDIGRAAHRAVLGRGADYVAIPDELLSSNGAVSTKAAKAWVEEQREAGLTPLKADEVAAIETMAAKVRAYLRDFGIVIDPDLSEVTAVAEVDGAMCRCRVDNAPEAEVMIPGVGRRKIWLDFKTTEDARPEAFRRSVENYGYDFQRAFYGDTWRAACGEEREMLFVAQEKKAPFEIGLHLLRREKDHSEDFHEDASQRVTIARALWRDCLASNQWGGYAKGINILGARPFYRQQWQDQASRLVLTSKPSRAALDAWFEAQKPTRKSA